jgi:hypothetical protein
MLFHGINFKQYNIITWEAFFFLWPYELNQDVFNGFMQLFDVSMPNIFPINIL